MGPGAPQRNMGRSRPRMDGWRRRRGIHATLRTFDRPVNDDQDRRTPLTSRLHGRINSRMRNRARLLGVLLTLMVVASLAIRVAGWAYWGTGTIESEGAEYAKIAENLRNGVGYIGLVAPGPQVNFNPLFP